MIRFAYVRTPHQASSEALSILVKCLHSLPNLHTLFLRPVIRDARGPIANALNGHQFSQVQNLIIAARDAQFILRCCPSARVVVAKYRMFEELDLLGPGALHESSCYNLEELDGFNPDAATMQRTFFLSFLCTMWV
jgi:hypothetical protein